MSPHPRARLLAVTGLLAILGTACTDKEPTERRDLTRRERDSIIGESVLPGAQGVKGALRVADSASARQRRAQAIN